MTELNGICGIAEFLDPRTGRYEVRCDDGQVRKVRPVNLKAAEPAALPSAAGVIKTCETFLEATCAWWELKTQLALEGDMVEQLAPLWSRSIRLWQQLERYLDSESPEIAASLAPPVSSTSWKQFEVDLQLSLATSPHLLALRLLYARHNGQHLEFDWLFALNNSIVASSDLASAIAPRLTSITSAAAKQFEPQRCLGLVGGYSAYNELVNVRLLPLELLAAWSRKIQAALHMEGVIAFAASFDFQKVFLLDVNTGEVISLGQGNTARQRAVPRSAAAKHGSSYGAELITWLEELAARITNGMYVREELVPLYYGMALFPRNGPLHSVAVSRGIRVDASAVYAPESGRMIYSIRLTLLAAGEPEAMSVAERGFDTAQLHSRHWIITDLSGHEEHVRGDGVVGKYPLLREGGYRDDQQNRGAGNSGVQPQDVMIGREHTGTFKYQSMSSPSAFFEGELFFVPGSLREPIGEEFTVRVAPFPISHNESHFIF
eukprot:CAMPEP_0119342840 /NCGR_PEP_ID=MMETSP1333-20130426/105563_1 /TAXON_ID=418940 /ORGANISM="Scyphosphaera apsteinii, Strain RCC1455" /LENGTH=489 /DNA_ID=CAMNT_0007355135 /DNA_START=413 /DNA_END=1882 /DNA_ORIENTATION=+